ncbi:MAG: ABC transporter permease [Vicinamibacterales bacterium]
MESRLFRWLLRLLPEEVRDGYAREIERTFHDEVRDVRRSGRRWALLGLWLATMADVAKAAPAQHLDILWRDLRFAFRSMRARPAHTLTAVVTLAIGIGANVAMFAVVDGVLLAPLDYRDADQLVAVAETRQGDDPVTMGYLSYVDLKRQARTVTHLVAATQSTATFSGGGQDAERVNAMRVSRDYFDLVGVQPRLGRAFTDAEDRPGAARRVAILSDGLWRRRFAADPGVIGRPVVIGDFPHVIVGVMPAGFDDLVASRLYKDAGVWFPLGYDPAASFACRTCRHLRVFGRLAPGTTPEAAELELTGLFVRMAESEPGAYTSPGARVTRLRDVLLGPVRPALLLLWGGVAVLLLVACANVASLLLLRASERSGEVAVRAALGVTRVRLVRQLLTESVLLSAAGALLGLVPAWAAVRLMASAGPAELPRLAGLSLDARAVTAAVVLAMASGALFGLAPLRRLTRGDAGDELRGAGRRTGGAGMWRARALIVAGNVAMAAVLLAGSGVLVRSVNRLLAVEPGIDPHGVLTMRLWAGGQRFAQGDTPQQIAAAVAFYDQVLSGVRALPGVTSASAVTTLPLGGDIDSFGFHVAGRLSANPADAPSADRFVVTSDYFATLGIPLVRGRLIDARDGPDAERVALINRQAAATLFGGDDPIGRQVMIGPATAPPRTIVGIVGDVRHRGLDQPVEPQVYVPQAQWVWAETLMTLVVRAAGDPLDLAGAVRGVVRDVDPAQPVTDVRRYGDVVAATSSTRRFVAGVLAAFAGLALVLAVVGLYGALSVTVAQRRMEIGIRLALGARAGTIRRMVFAHGLRPVLAGVVVGLMGALAALQAATGLLFDVGPSDPAALAGTATLLLGAGAAACAVPAWRASRIDPAASLRAE